ncbi:MAG: nitrogen fixation protein NifZ [Pseudomonadota bacterium]
MSTDDREIEVYRDPAYEPGDKVISKKNIKNDGTMAGKEIGETVVKKGDVGYVRDIGVFLQQFYIYAVDFEGRDSIVGMRERELELSVAVPRSTDGSGTVLQSHIVTRQPQEAAP